MGMNLYWYFHYQCPLLYNSDIGTIARCVGSNVHYGGGKKLSEQQQINMCCAHGIHDPCPPLTPFLHLNAIPDT